MIATVLRWSRDSANWLYLLLAYPVIDYVMRNLLPIPVVSSFWDEGLLLVLLAYAFAAWLRATRKLPGIKQPLIAFFVLGIGLMVTDMANWDASVEGFRAVYQYILAFFAGFYLIRSAGQLENVTKVLVAVGFFVGLYGIIQVLMGVKVPGSWVGEGESFTSRAFSIVTSPNVLGSYMALVAPAALGLFLKSRMLRDRLIWGVAFLTATAALVATGSRGAWFAFAVVLFVGAWLWNRRVALIVLLAGAVAAAALLIVPDVPVVGKVKDRLFNLFTVDYFEKSLSDGRLARWIRSYHVMRHEPLFGAGLGHHGGAVASRHFGSIYSDSYFFKTLAEMGLLGIGFLLTLVTMTLGYGRRLVRKWTGTPPFFLALGLFCGLLAVALHNLVENIFEVPFMSLFFWVFGGMLCALATDDRISQVHKSGLPAADDGTAR